MEGREAGWPAWTYICLVACVPVFLLFIAYERRETATNGSPLVVLALFHLRAFVVGLFISMLFLAGIPAFFLTFSLYLQIGLGFSALHAGLTTLPFAIGSFFASAASARVAARLGRNVLFIGCAVLLAGMSLVLLTIHLAGIGITTPEFIPSLLICGLGLGSVIAPLINVILAGIPSRDAGSASGLLTTVQQVGGAIGVAVIGVIFFGLLGSNSAHIGREVTPGLQSDLVAIHFPAPAVRSAVKGFLRCFHDRSNSSDPTQIPPSCQQTAKPGTPAYTAFRRTADIARERDFSESFSTGLVFEFLCFGATFLLVLLLPKASPAALAREGGVGGH